MINSNEGLGTQNVHAKNLQLTDGESGTAFLSAWDVIMELPYALQKT